MGRKMPLIELGLQIRNELAKKNMTQMELANATGINYRVIHDVMTGRNRSDKNIKAIKEELGLNEVSEIAHK